MARIRIAHFSDIHYTLSPLQQAPESLRGKRLAGSFSYYFSRRERFAHNRERIAALLNDIDGAGVDHALCTGDLTAVSLPEEFAGLAELFGERLQHPERFTTLPGNHDRYVGIAVRDRLFERHFSALCGGERAAFPFAKTIAPGLRIVALDAARPTSLTDSTGLCGEEQLAAFADLLSADTEAVTLVAMHYGLLRWKGEADKPHHRMRDWEDVLSVIDNSPARVSLVLHGHMHGAFTARSRNRTIICAGSAIDLLVDCGYFIYDIDLETLSIRIERRHWNRSQQAYEPVDCVDFETAVREKKGRKLAHQAPLT